MSMNILLLVAPAPPPGTVPFVTTEKRPPLGVASLMAVLRKAGHTVFFEDFYLKPVPLLYDARFLLRQKIDLVGLYSSSITWGEALKLLTRLHRYRETGVWKGLLAVGGPHTSFSAEKMPAWIDYIVIGEGEKTLCKIAEGALKPGILRGEAVEDMDALPLLPWEDLVPRHYDRTAWGMDFPAYTLNTSRGCPFSCTFCSVKGVWGNRYRCMSAQRVLEEVAYLIKYYGLRSAYFREDHFTLDRHRTIDFCEGLLQRNMPVMWACESRADSIDDEELIKLMARSGCRTLYIGVESGSPRMLKLLKKGETVEQFRRVLGMAGKYGIRVYASMICGVPGEAEEDVRLTDAFLQEMQPDFVGRNVFVGLPGSDLYDQIVALDLCAYEDPVTGIRYLKGHDERARKYYGPRTKLLIPQKKGKPVHIEEGEALPPVSVVTCVYNGEACIRACIESILAQTHQDFEHIIVDDGSTDATPEILRAYAARDSRIRILTNERNRQQSYSRNRAINEAEHELIAILDADDLAVPQRLEWQARHLQVNRQIMLCGGGMRVQQSGQLVMRFATNDEIRAGILFSAPFLHSTVMFRRSEVMQRTGGYDCNVVNAQDYDLWLRLAEHADVHLANLPRVLVEYSSGELGKGARMWLEQQKTVRAALRRHMRRHEREVSEKQLEWHLRAFEMKKISSLPEMYEFCMECVWCNAHNTTFCRDRSLLAYRLYETAAKLCEETKKNAAIRKELLAGLFEVLSGKAADGALLEIMQRHAPGALKK